MFHCVLSVVGVFLGHEATFWCTILEFGSWFSVALELNFCSFLLDVAQGIQEDGIQKCGNMPCTIFEIEAQEELSKEKVEKGGKCSHLFCLDLTCLLPF